MAGGGGTGVGARLRSEGKAVVRAHPNTQAEGGVRYRYREAWRRCRGGRGAARRGVGADRQYRSGTSAERGAVQPLSQCTSACARVPMPAHLDERVVRLRVGRRELEHCRDAVELWQPLQVSFDGAAGNGSNIGSNIGWIKHWIKQHCI
eukprot:357325-Chlamydomonas_euryale.AAC.2